MKYFVKWSNIVISVIFICLIVSVKAQDITVSAKSAILICADSGSVIFAKNEREPLPMASTTKIMTSLLALENMEACGNKEVEITDDMVRVEGTSMGLMPGNIVDLNALAEGMLTVSGNDAANAAAIAVGGSTENFINLMNEKAKLIGMKNTKFCTPSGLDKNDHHSTAEDMAFLGAYAMENENFANIVSKKSIKVHFINPNKYVTMKNHNKLLRLYDGCIGIKTGFTKSAGRCLVSCAQKDSAKLVCVTLNAPNDWDDHIKLYNYGFENITSKIFDDTGFSIEIPTNDPRVASVSAKSDSAFQVCVPRSGESKIRREVEIPSLCNLPVEKGQIIGNVVYYLDENVIGKNAIISNETIVLENQKSEGLFSKIKSFFARIFHL